MPTVGVFHTQYWAVSDTTAPPVLAASLGGYPRWQASVIASSLLGVIGAWWDVWWARIRWWLGFAPRIHRLDSERRAVLVGVLETLESPHYRAAQRAVRRTATTLGFSRPEAWKDLSRALKDSPGRAENTFRHLEACKLLRETAGSTLTNPQQHLLVELAYQGFAWKGQ